MGVAGVLQLKNIIKKSVDHAKGSLNGYHTRSDVHLRQPGHLGHKICTEIIRTTFFVVFFCCQFSCLQFLASGSLRAFLNSPENVFCAGSMSYSLRPHLDVKKVRLKKIGSSSGPDNFCTDLSF